MIERLTLEGCRPTPLASYLKALGVLRVLSSGANNVAGNPADAEARGWWEEERFHLRTSLGREEVVNFFLHDYAPSPVIAPWNGGSGFYAKDNKDGFRPLSSGPVADRFRPFSMAIEVASGILRTLGLSEKPAGDEKTRLVAMLRARLPEDALSWIDAALVLSGEGLRFPQLLGTGGNDGRLDFTNNFMQRLVSQSGFSGLFKASSGAPSPRSASLLDGALFAAQVQLTGAKVGQFSPGGAGGPNATTGYTGESTVNPWDYVLMLEGATTFACAATRRHESNAMARASFPFTVAPSGAGWGGVEAVDESEARAEFWAPLWNRPARSCEIEALFGEGRAVTNGRTAGDGLDFARALGALGVSRGFSEFQRFGFFMRAGKNHYAAAIGRRRAERSRGAELMADLDEGSWLAKARRYGREGNHPAAVRNAVKALEDRAFELLAPACTSGSVRAVLASVGRLAAWLGNSPKGRESVPPPPLLSRSWLLCADDGSPEFRVASALAGLGVPVPFPPGDADDESASSRRSVAPPMAAHFAPLTNGPARGFERDTFYSHSGGWLRKRRTWAGEERPSTVVWGHGDLISNMTAVLERRLVEVRIRGSAEKPFGSASCARLSDVMAFLSGDFDDARCSSLLAGLVWTQPGRLPGRGMDAGHASAGTPFAYAALKPVYTTDESLRRSGAIPRHGSVPVPTGLIGRLRAGGKDLDGRAVDSAVQDAFARLRSSGLPAAFDRTRTGGWAGAQDGSRIGAGVRPDRLAAAMLIPISDLALDRLLRRAYPGSTPDAATHPSEEPPHAA